MYANVKVGDLYYILNEINKTACVTHSSEYNFDTINIPHSITYNKIDYTVARIGYEAFRSNKNLVSVSIPYSITSIDLYAFCGCSNLTSVVIPPSVTSIENHAFDGCTKLSSISIPNSVTSIGDEAFCRCSNLTSITIPNSVTSMGILVLSECRSLAEINFIGTIEQWITKSWKTTQLTWKSSSYSFYMNGVIVHDVIIPNNTTTIPEGLFYNCKSLTHITIPNTVTCIEPRAFSSCYYLTSVDISNSVTSIGESAFAGVANISYNGSATGSPWGAKCKNGFVDGYFVYSNSLKSTLRACSAVATGKITIPMGVLEIGKEAFRYCENATSVIIPKTVTNIQKSAFFNCDSLVSVYIGSGVRNIATSAFGHCNNLTSVICFALLPPTIYQSTFEGMECPNTPLYVPEESITTYMYADYWKVFNPILPIQITEEDLITEGIDNLIENTSRSKKVLRNGQVLIQRGEKIYTITGIEL